MTGKVGLKEDEYLELADQLKKVHTSSIEAVNDALGSICLLYTSPSPRD